MDPSHPLHPVEVLVEGYDLLDPPAPHEDDAHTIGHGELAVVGEMKGHGLCKEPGVDKGDLAGIHEEFVQSPRGLPASAGSDNRDGLGHDELGHEEVLGDVTAHAERVLVPLVPRVSEGEAVVTSAVHFSEVANVLEDWMGLEAAQAVERGLCARETVEILPVARGDLLDALSTGSEVGVGTTDALAAVLMRDRGLRDIYSFDRDFDRFEDLRRVMK